MSALSHDPDVIKVVHTYGVGLHTTETDPDVHDPQWQRRQVRGFVEFAVQAEALGFDGITVTEHHAPSMTCPSPHLLLAAAAERTTRIRIGTAVTTLPLYSPIRVAEEAGTLDLLSGGRFELGIGRGVPGETLMATGRDLDPDRLMRQWLEGLRLLWTALTERDFTFDGEFTQVTRPTTIATRPLRDPLPVWLGGASLDSMGQAAQRGWNIMRNFGTHEDHRNAFEHYVKTGAEHGHSLSGANLMIERFVALGETPERAERNLDRMTRAYGRFIAVYTAGGLRAVPETDAEFHLDNAARKRRPVIAISGTPEEIVRSLRQTVEETGARRLLVETFSSDEMELFAREVLPALREHP
ncbi:LLM class flavin-dependent oxidoreductase [Pseudonocardia acaciae]|uniref:LLM class flavin-dependent oxidoreductase n=1 Tax=Pseudonocardia acaciae TaxID=551276 RepID=UPI0006863E5A|nr:LLM class flavin-dependent oxidoreductase [Pseudonocardia acaciae]